MKTRTLLFSLLLLIFVMQLSGQEFLITNGKAIVNESGDSIILRGMGLGGWMLQESGSFHESLDLEGLVSGACVVIVRTQGGRILARDLVIIGD